MGMKSKQWDLVILLGALCLLGDAIGRATGFIGTPMLLFLSVLGFILIGAGAYGKRRKS